MGNCQCCNKCHVSQYLQTAAVANGDGQVFNVLGYPSVAFEVYGTIAGGTDVAFEFLSGLSTWTALPVINASTGATETSGIVSAGGTYIANTAGLSQVKARVLNYGGADSINVLGTALCEGAGTAVGGSSSGEVGLTDRLDVDNDHVTAVQAIVSKVITPVMTASPDYSIGDAIGTVMPLAAVMEPNPDASASAGKTARLLSVHLVDRAGQTPAISIYFFNAAPSGGTYTDNAAIVWAAGDAAKQVGLVRIQASDWKTLGGVSSATIGDINQGHYSVTDAISVLLAADSVYNGASAADLTLTFAYQR